MAAISQINALTLTNLRSGRGLVALPPEHHLLLLEVASVLLVDQHKVEVVLDAEDVVHAAVGGREVQRGQEQADGHALALDRRAVHQLVLDQVLALVVAARTHACAHKGQNNSS